MSETLAQMRDRLRELEAKATPGPWEEFRAEQCGILSTEGDERGGWVGTIYNEDSPDAEQADHDLRLIVALRNTLPTLLAELDAYLEREQEEKPLEADCMFCHGIGSYEQTCRHCRRDAK